MTFTSEANYDLGPASRYYVSESKPDSVGEWSLAGNQGFVRASLFDVTGALAASIAQGIFIRHPGP